MSAVRNTMRLIKKADRYIDDRYDIHYSNAKEISDSSKGELDMILNAFRFGYMQALKAVRAEQKAKAAVT